MLLSCYKVILNILKYILKKINIKTGIWRRRSFFIKSRKAGINLLKEQYFQYFELDIEVHFGNKITIRSQTYYLK